MSSSQEVVHFVKLPGVLRRPEVLGAVDLGLFWLAGGDRPHSVPGDKTYTTTRVRLSARGMGYLGEARPYFRSMRQALIAALTLVLERPELCRQTMTISSEGLHV